ncbi:MAG: flavodoxin [Clostridium sp.]|nr:flavodoxin [Clostridium sp.]
MSEIIIYYSHAGENYICGQIKNLKSGITEKAAVFLQELTGAMLFRIEPLVPEPRELSAFVNQTMNDLQRNARPELLCYPEIQAGIKTIYLGYPNYYHTMPPAVYSFLERTDLTGKRIRLFCTHGGDGFGDSVEAVRRLCPGCEIVKGAVIRDTKIAEAKDILKKWIADGTREI